MRVAFKEWAVVVDALGSGEQIILLRKGGIREGKNGFCVEHQRFLLFPTSFHQQRESVVADAQVRFDKLSSRMSDPSSVCLAYFADVVEWIVLDSMAAVEHLREHHIWRDEVIRQRFEWGTSKGVYAMAVRVYRLPTAIEIPMLPSYGGCRSWMEIEQEIETSGGLPVLDDTPFAEKLNRFRSVAAGQKEAQRS